MLPTVPSRDNATPFLSSSEPESLSYAMPVIHYLNTKYRKKNNYGWKESEQYASAEALKDMIAGMEGKA